MLYNLLPNSPKNGHNCPFVKWENAFTDEEIQKINEYISTLERCDAGVGGNSVESVVDKKIRNSKISWINNNQDSMWIWDRMAYIMRNVCSYWYNYDLSGFLDPIQYTEYDSELSDEPSYYEWHEDWLGDGCNLQRKLSMSVLLSDPNDYVGGEFQFLFPGDTFDNPTTIERKKGMAVIFPSFRMHRVSPVISGARKSLVLWGYGPAFR